ncbi:hypothetical protein CXB51_029329 [Gossypium anomalum]|uniref:Strictosidine synthase conserved region domain-containing protein n=1 Tax=Gossypium anomalum TaxID=47600 RepID=A0A8J6CR94_9ROSI|nr:hypothetical protein CXB51_029329 [Gossypium anomalum]
MLQQSSSTHLMRGVRSNRCQIPSNLYNKTTSFAFHPSESLLQLDSILTDGPSRRKKTRLQHHSQNYTFAQFGETVLHFEKFGLLATDSVLESQAVGTMEGGGMFQNYITINLTKVIDGDGGVLFKNYSQINLNCVTGPESIAFDCKGKGPYVGISDGRILKWKPKFGWQEFAIPSPFRERKLCDGTRDSNVEPICGRPLGLKFDSRTCHLYIADAYFGLLVVGPNGGTAIRLAISAASGAPFKFTNGLDIDTSTGMVYFIDSSTLFQRRDADFLISSGDRTGRLLKYNPYNGDVSVLCDGLAFPNWVAFSANNSFLLVNESIKRRILKFNVHDPKAAPKVFLELPRVPDNIKRNEKGEFWVALNSGRLGTLGNGAPDPIGMRFNEEATVLEILDGKGAPTFNSISEVAEYGGKLYIGSVLKSYNVYVVKFISMAPIPIMQIKEYLFQLVGQKKSSLAMSSLAPSDGWYSSQNTYLLLSPYGVDADGLYDLAVTTLNGGDSGKVFQNYITINLTKVIDGDGGVLFKNYSQINLNCVTGPESIAFDCKGKGPYVGISDGRILKWKPKFGWQEFAIPSPFRERKLCDGTRDSNVEPICGRPLGLKFDSRTCHLYIADAYFGLLVVGPNGGTAIRLAISAASGAPFKFTNGLDIDTSTGMVYFIDSSTLFQRRDADFLISSGDRTGRLLKYNPYNGDVSVLCDGLAFPNWVAFSANNSFLLVNESIKRRILKFNVHDPKAAPKVFLELPRVPDNIKRNEKGEFWVALNSGRLGTLGNGAPDPIGMRFNEEATVLEILDGKGAPTFNSISEVAEYGGNYT